MGKAGEIDVARLDGWVMIAQPGARLVYGRGFHHGACVAGVPERARLLYEHGLLRLHHVPSGDPAAPYDFTAIRSTKPAPKALAALAALKPGSAVEPFKAVMRNPRAIGPGGRAW